MLYLAENCVNDVTIYRNCVMLYEINRPNFVVRK